MLKYSGHPFVDIGVATITAFAGKEKPEQVDEPDLEMIAEFMTENYTINPLRSFLTVVFPNSGFTQPAFFNSPEKQETYANRVLRSHQSTTPSLDIPCVFFDLPAVDITFDVYGNLAPGRAFRQHIPLITGENVINFHPYGDAGLPVSGLALLAIQAFPLGCAKCGGRLLAVHSDNSDITFFFASRFLSQNRAALSLAQSSNSKKMPEPVLKYRSLVIETLLDAREMQLEYIQLEESFSITVYYFSNSGQGVDLEIYHIPSQMILYLKEMQKAEYSHLWKTLVMNSWDLSRIKSNKKNAPSDGFQPSRNLLFEDLFLLSKDVYQFSPRFIRAHFLKATLALMNSPTFESDETTGVMHNGTSAIWKLTESFLRRIINMEAERIEQIRKLGDAIAEYVITQNEARFFRSFYMTNNYYHLRNLLIKANTDHVKRGKEPFLTLDGFLSVFEEGEELARVDWRLARDLVLIRLVEELHKNGWFGAHRNDIPDITIEEDTIETASN